jgi:hypothetical protein
VPDIVLDCTVVHNFAVLGLCEELEEVLDGRILVTHGVAPLEPQETSELTDWAERYELQLLHETPGSPRYTAILNAVHGLGQLLGGTSIELEILVPTSVEMVLFARIRRPDEVMRQRCGLKVRALGVGESVSIAVAVERGLGFASDDLDARKVFACLSDRPALFTRDLLEQAVNSSILSLDQARRGYDLLRSTFRFRAPPW